MNRRRFLERACVGASGLAASACTAPGPTKAAINQVREADIVLQTQLLAAGDTSAAELMRDAIARSKQVNGRLNAVVHLAEREATARAQSETFASPLRGVPYLIKDLSDVAGMPTTSGSRGLMTRVAEQDAPIVAAMKSAGANIFGKTNTPEFGLIATTESLALGACRNPWNTDHSSGGSSGGAAAAVAAGIIPAAQASDGGGSIRIPASCCGLVGLKTSRGRMAGEQDQVSMTDISVKHAVSRTVRDNALLLAMGEAQGGAAGLSPVGMVNAPIDRPLRIAFSTVSAKGVEADPDVRAAQLQTAKLCANLGHIVEEVAPTYDGQAFEDAFMDLWSGGAWGIRKSFIENGVGESALGDLLEPWTLFLADHFEKVGPGSIETTIAQFTQVKLTVDAFMSDYDVWLTPVLAKAPIRIGEQSPAVPPATLYDRTFKYVAYTLVANALGNPAISVPLHWNAQGLPIGSMFSAKWGEEALLLQLAYQLEQAQPWAARKPGVWAA